MRPGVGLGHGATAPPDGLMGTSFLAWWARSRPSWSIEMTVPPVVKVSDGDD
jgi:hypothetical protein